MESSPLETRHCGAAGSSCGAAARVWSQEEAANRREGPLMGSFFVKGRDCLNSSRSEWIGSSSCFLASLDSFPCSPPPCVMFVCSWAAPGLRIPAVVASRHQ
ncbi:hypothetical protein Taro_045203 [Colocasia esculenta]|uniref:Uncharacterized protein n=1 Tax=Colocasia esculenta TaxID=4460 RepID=A0A843WLC8_COLES|nr:hypothetical protein [Colocasia esculenta]